ncbi:MAG: cupin domain-containing protein [Methylobacteriaceae bacterium]|nr:cupin domain-containing protein [Methylobacteriaceae bacterium]
MDITRATDTPSRRGNPDWFTGTVWQDPIVDPPAPARARAARVAFEPGARTAWHTHPLGQTLHIVHGVGRVQALGGPVREVRAGDTVVIPPNEKHWHGASPTHGMVHIAIHEFDGEKHVTWMEKVTDADYAVEPSR